MCDYRSMKWQAPGTNNSISKKQLTPRVSLIVGLDLNGEIFLSVTQTNTNDKIMEIFLR